MEFEKSDTRRLVDGNIKVKHSAVVKRVVPYFLLFVLLGITVFALIGKSKSKQAFFECISEMIGMLAPKNAVIEKCGDNYCFFSCGLTRDCLLYKNNTADWEQIKIDPTILLEEGNTECYNKIICTKSVCKYGNITIANGCSSCVSRKWLRKLQCRN